MPNAKAYHKMKNAYLLTVNGCGQDCLTCERPSCICDSKKVRELAAKWVKQKGFERDFYYNHRQERLKSVKEYYEKHRKRNTPGELRITTEATLNQLPEEFTYDEAAKAWGVIKHTAVERVKKLLARFPGCIIKEPQSGPKPMKMRRI